MKKTTILILFHYTIILFTTYENFASTQNLSGTEIFNRSAERFNQPYEKENINMILLDKNGNKEERKMIRLTYKYEKDLYKYLAIFTKPNAIRGVALLTWQNSNEVDDQWMYLPSLGKKMKKIAKGNKKKPFMGTDYSYEDIMSENKNNFIYKRLSDEQTHYKLEVTSKSSLAKQSGYKYRLLYIRKDNYFIERIKYYNNRSQFMKEQIFEEIRKVADTGKGIWRAKKAIMENKINGHKTIMHFSKNDFNQNNIKESYFSKNYILSERHLKLK